VPSSRRRPRGAFLEGRGHRHTTNGRTGFSTGAVTRVRAITIAMQASIFRFDLPFDRVNPRSPGRIAAAVTCE
jgi:hypothetical protein